ncbi:MAG: DUF6496 domain-containing protein [Ferruginibacter sp.]
MAKYSKGAQKSVAGAMKKMEKGSLKIGNSSKKVTSKNQAIAIGLSEAKRKAAKVPTKKPAAPKKVVAKKAAPKKAVPKKAVAKKAMAKKTAPKKSVKKAAPKKAAAKNISPVKKAAPKNVAPKRIAPKKAAPKKAVAKKSKSIAKSTPAKPPVNTPTPMPEMNDEVQAPVQDENIVNTPAVSDPITITDQKVYNKATSKVDPKHNMPVSSTRKGGIKPSGKKPMW